MKANAVNLATFTNALCHRNATPLSVAVLAPCAWGENLACGVAWQSALNSVKRNTAWRCEFDNETAKRGDTANSVRGQWSNACRRSGQSENGAVFGRGTSLSLSLSLSLLALFGTLKFLNTLFLGFCALFVILSVATQRVARRKPQQKNPQRLKENLPFLDTSLSLSMTNSGFCLKITDIFTQIFHSKFKAFYKFNSFYKFISNFKPYTRLFHIFTPSFRSVQTDKFQYKEKKWQIKTPSLIILSI